MRLRGAIGYRLEPSVPIRERGQMLAPPRIHHNHALKLDRQSLHKRFPCENGVYEASL